MRVRFWIGKAVGFAICEPQLRIGRRRHDNLCDECGRDCGSYAMDKLDFDVDGDDVDVDDRSTLETIKCLLDAEYVRVCLECSTGEDE